MERSLAMSDKGLSAFKGEHLKRGALGVFRAAVSAAQIQSAALDAKYGKGKYDGVALIFENFDRVTRLKPMEALSLFQDLTDHGLECHDVSDSSVLRKDFGNDEEGFELMKFAMKASGSYRFSKRLSRALSSKWAAKERTPELKNCR